MLTMLRQWVVLRSCWIHFTLLDGHKSLWMSVLESYSLYVKYPLQTHVNRHLAPVLHTILGGRVLPEEVVCWGVGHAGYSSWFQTHKCNSSARKVAASALTAQGLYQLHCEFETRLGYMRPH